MNFANIVIVFRLAVATIASSLQAIFVAIFCNEKRKRADKIIHHWARQLLKIVKANYQVAQAPKFEFMPGRRYIIMSNHLSLFDIPLIYVTFPQATIRMVAKKELFKIPIFGWGLKTSEVIAIDRHNRMQAMKDLELAKAKMQSGIVVWIAPEGTRSRTGELGQFKKGGFKLAIDAKAIIVPVTIVGSDKILAAKSAQIHCGQKITMHIGQPIDAGEYQPQDVNILLNLTANAIAANVH